ncbi:Solute carrier family 23 member 2, partial [Lamellibrachia satsuma]
LQGCLTMASLLEIFIGFIGGVGFLMRFIGPISIAPTIFLIGMSLAPVVSHLCATQWWIAIMTSVLLGLFSQLMTKISIPGAEYLPGVNGKKRTRVFQTYAVMLTIVTSWLICAILTATNVLPPTRGSWGYEARTDIRIDSLRDTPWFRIPYPGQFGGMSFSVAGVIGMMIAILASVLESIGIFTEGIGCLIGGLWGTGVGSTSYSENIGAIGLTKGSSTTHGRVIYDPLSGRLRPTVGLSTAHGRVVLVASRRVIQVGAFLVLVVGIFGKVGALIGTIPSPVIGGVLLVVLGMICMIGISNLQTVDLNSMRNLFILGFSLFTGIVVPPWVSDNKDTIRLGNDTVNQAVVILLTTSMAVGGVIAFILDNALSGTREERGMADSGKVEQTMDNETSTNQTVSSATIATYDMPFGMSVIRKAACLRYLPISPTYRSKRDNSVTRPANGEHSNDGFDHNEITVP